jgi:integrase
MYYFLGGISMTKRKDPKYRHHKARNLAVVRIDGKDYYLGRFGSQESRAKYHRLLADWRAGLLNHDESNGRRESDNQHAGDAILIADLVPTYERFAEEYYQKDGVPTQPGIKVALRYLQKTFGHVAAMNFGPKALKTVRARMIDNDLSRRYINDNINRIRRCFRWATEEELIPGYVYQSLRAVSSLAAGRSAARETAPIGPVDLETVEVTLCRLSDTVADMVRSQLLLACRPSEICRLNAAEIDRTCDVWVYEPQRHKTEHRGQTRQILIGPRAQRLLASYLFRPPETPCFVSRRTGRGYTTGAYRLTIIRACKKAGITKWTPHQLRHTKATEVRAKFGLEAAQVFLGHGSADVTQIYAERNLMLAQKVARAVG